MIDWPDWEDWDRWLLSLFWFAWNVFNRLGTGLDRPDFQLDMGVKQSQSNNHGTRLAYGRLCRQPMWPYPEKVVGPARLCRGCQAWLKGNPCLKKKWSSNSTWWKIYSSAGMGANPFKSSRVWWGPIAFMVLFQPPKGSQGPIFFGLPKRGFRSYFQGTSSAARGLVKCRDLQLSPSFASSSSHSGLPLSDILQLLLPFLCIGCGIFLASLPELNQIPVPELISNPI